MKKACQIISDIFQRLLQHTVVLVQFSRSKNSNALLPSNQQLN